MRCAVPAGPPGDAAAVDTPDARRIPTPPVHVAPAKGGEDHAWVSTFEAPSPTIASPIGALSARRAVDPGSPSWRRVGLPLRPGDVAARRRGGPATWRPGDVAAQRRGSGEVGPDRTGVGSMIVASGLGAVCGAAGGPRPVIIVRLRPLRAYRVSARTAAAGRSPPRLPPPHRPPHRRSPRRRAAAPPHRRKIIGLGPRTAVCPAAGPQRSIMAQPATGIDRWISNAISARTVRGRPTRSCQV